VDLHEHSDMDFVTEAANSIAVAAEEDNIVVAVGEDSMAVERLGIGFELRDTALVVAGRNIAADDAVVVDYFFRPEALSIWLCPY
jgi:hypothetical protein